MYRTEVAGKKSLVRKLSISLINGIGSRTYVIFVHHTMLLSDYAAGVEMVYEHLGSGAGRVCMSGWGGINCLTMLGFRAR